MRMRKLRGPNKKMSMPFEPFRTHTQPVNLDDLEARFDAGAVRRPRRAAGRRPGHAQGHPRQGAGPRRAVEAADRARPRVLEDRARADRGRGRHDRRRGVTSKAGDDRHDLQRLPGPRDPQEAALHGAAAGALPARRLHPRPGREHRGGQADRGELHRLQRPRPAEPVQRRRAVAAGASSRWASCPTSRRRSSCSCCRWSRRRWRSSPRRARSARRGSRSTRAT